MSLQVLAGRLQSDVSHALGRGDPNQFEQVGQMILEVLSALEREPNGDEQVERAVRSRVRELCSQFPIYPHAEALV